MGCRSSSSSTSSSSTSSSSLLSFESAPTVDPTRFPLTVLPDFITEEEEATLVADAERMLRRHSYEASHWDQAIVGFREAQRSFGMLSPSSRAVALRVVAQLPPGSVPQPFFHFLDLLPDGVIHKHVDSVKFSGQSILGLSLLSDGVMRFHREAAATLAAGSETLGGFERKAPEADWRPAPGSGAVGEVVSALLPRRSLYVMTGLARYGFSHEVTVGEQFFAGRRILRTRRIAAILRDEVPAGVNWLDRDSKRGVLDESPYGAPASAERV